MNKTIMKQSTEELLEEVTKVVKLRPLQKDRYMLRIIKFVDPKKREQRLEHKLKALELMNSRE